MANKRLRRKVAPFGYYECIKTPGLWKHEMRPLTFTLVVDDFGVKYESKDDVDHLIASLAGKVANTTATCRPDSQMPAHLANMPLLW